MTFRLSLLLASALLLAPCAPAKDRPNILFIMSDDHTAQAVGPMRPCSSRSIPRRTSTRCPTAEWSSTTPSSPTRSARRRAPASSPGNTTTATASSISTADCSRKADPAHPHAQGRLPDGRHRQVAPRHRTELRLLQGPARPGKILQPGLHGEGRKTMAAERRGPQRRARVGCDHRFGARLVPHQARSAKTLLSLLPLQGAARHVPERAALRHLSRRRHHPRTGNPLEHARWLGLHRHPRLQRRTPPAHRHLHRPPQPAPQLRPQMGQRPGTYNDQPNASPTRPT
jgi:hypothetical protein